jgi:alcohol dehydrogenase (cytochrome c)
MGESAYSATVTVANFEPVTDDMLVNPDPGDWLMIRGDYQATSYTELDQITPANVEDLELVYSLPMNEPGTNQPAPPLTGFALYVDALPE